MADDTSPTPRPSSGSNHTGRIPARATFYKGIRMRSRLEARFARLFDRLGLDWEYEPDCYGDEHGEYLPDFRISGHIYVEIKPPLIETEVNAIRRRMQIIRNSEPDAALWLIHLEPEWVGGFSIDASPSDQPTTWTRWHIGPDSALDLTPFSHLLRTP